MEKTLIKLLVAIGELADKALTVQSTSDMWFKYYTEGSDRERVLREENEKLRAELTEFRSKTEGLVEKYKEEAGAK